MEWEEINDITPPEQLQAALAKYRMHASDSGAVIEHVDWSHNSTASKGRVQRKNTALMFINCFAEMCLYQSICLTL